MHVARCETPTVRHLEPFRLQELSNCSFRPTMTDPAVGLELCEE
jgi:hypothetical protein